MHAPWEVPVALFREGPLATAVPDAMWSVFCDRAHSWAGEVDARFQALTSLAPSERSREAREEEWYAVLSRLAVDTIELEVSRWRAGWCLGSERVSAGVCVCEGGCACVSVSAEGLSGLWAATRGR